MKLSMVEFTRSNWILLLGWAMVNYFDLHTTFMGLNSGLQEGNLIARNFVYVTPAIIAYKIFVTLLFGFILVRFGAKGLGAWPLTAAVIFITVVVCFNLVNIYQYGG